MGLSTAQAFILGLLSLVIVGVLTIIVLDALQSATSAGTTARNNSDLITANASEGLVSFFSNTGTWLTLLSVVVIILIIAAVILVVNRFSSGGGGGGGGSL